MLPENKKDWKYYPDADVDYSGCTGYFQTEDEVNRFITWLSTLKEKWFKVALNLMTVVIKL